MRIDNLVQDQGDIRAIRQFPDFQTAKTKLAVIIHGFASNAIPGTDNWVERTAHSILSYDYLRYYVYIQGVQSN